MTVDYTFTPDRAGQQRLLHSESGPYGQWLTRIGNQVANKAAQYANVDTGLMRSRIEFRIETSSDGLVGIVAARTNYSYFVHQGTQWYVGNPFLTDALRDVLASV